MTGLRIFEKHPVADAYRFGPSFTPYAIVATEKRFTDAELMAEAFREKSMRLQFTLYAERSAGGGKAFWTKDANQADERTRTLNRFATLPHYDEEPS